MNVHISWEAVTAIVAVMVALAAGLAWAIRAIVRAELAQLDEKLDHRYVLTGVFEAHTEALEGRMKRLERRHAA